MTSRLSSGARLVKRAKHEVEQEKHELIPVSDVSILPLLLYNPDNRQQRQRNFFPVDIYAIFKPANSRSISGRRFSPSEVGGREATTGNTSAVCWLVVHERDTKFC